MDEGRKAKSPKDDRHFTRGPVLDNIEALLIAVVLALTLRCFVVEAFAIPTGSMAETLRGNHRNVTCPRCGAQYAVGESSSQTLRSVYCPNCGERASSRDASRLYGGDRILVNKVLYRFEEPKRWDPFVFVNPHIKRDARPPKVTFIKRLLGLPEETLEIIRGDIIIDGQVQRKPRAAQRSLWMPVYDSRWPWDKAWIFDEEGNWTQTGGVLGVDGSALEKVAFADFAGLAGDRRIRDHYGYNTGLGRNVVTDVRVRLEVKARGKGSLVLVLPEDEHRLTLVLSDKGADKPSRVMLDDKVLKTLNVELPDDRSHAVEVARVHSLRRAAGGVGAGSVSARLWMIQTRWPSPTSPRSRAISSLLPCSTSWATSRPRTARAWSSANSPLARPHSTSTGKPKCLSTSRAMPASSRTCASVSDGACGSSASASSSSPRARITCPLLPIALSLTSSVRESTTNRSGVTSPLTTDSPSP